MLRIIIYIYVYVCVCVCVCTYLIYYTIIMTINQRRFNADEWRLTPKQFPTHFYAAPSVATAAKMPIQYGRVITVPLIKKHYL